MLCLADTACGSIMTSLTFQLNLHVPPLELLAKAAALLSKEPLCNFAPVDTNQGQGYLYCLQLKCIWLPAGV